MSMGYNTSNEPVAGSIQDTQGDTQLRRRPACPYCGSTETELFSLFGQQLLTVQFYCQSCHTPFEYVKDDALLDDYAARKDG